LRRFPVIREALLAGHTQFSQAMLLCRHATADNQQELVVLARGQTVRRLLRCLARRRERPADVPGEHTGPSNGACPPDDETSRGCDPLVDSGTHAPGEDAGGPAAVDLSVDPSPDPVDPLPEPWATLRLKAPRRLLLKFEGFPDFVRKLEGRPVGTGKALEILAAETSALALDVEITQQAQWRTPPIEGGRPDADDPLDGQPVQSAEVEGQAGAVEPGRVAPEDQVVQRIGEPAARREAESAPMAMLPPSLRDLLLRLYDPAQLIGKLNSEEPEELDSRLMALRNLMQQLHGVLGAALTRAKEAGLHKLLGYSSFESYCERRLGICRSKAYLMLQTQRVLPARRPWCSKPIVPASSRWSRRRRLGGWSAARMRRSGSRSPSAIRSRICCGWSGMS
jgi:hypothetical protein